MGADNDKNHCRLRKESDHQPLSKDRLEKTEPKTLITNLDRDTLTYNPNRPNYFSMQAGNNPSKKDSMASEKAESVITKGTQTSYIAFIKKINSQTGIIERKEQANLNLTIPTSRHIHDCLEVQPADDPRLFNTTTHRCKLVSATVQKRNS